MSKSFEDLSFKHEALKLLLVRINYLFEGKQMLLHTKVSNQVDNAGLSFAQETLYGIAASEGVSYGESVRKRYLFW
jgi:hypothetical protein